VYSLSPKGRHAEYALTPSQIGNPAYGFTAVHRDTQQQNAPT